jgi:pimeloyl-ACP methyl ester carboxylesterase
MDDPGYVARLESADADELARVITSAAGDGEITLREYLGDDRFDHMRELALRSTGVALAAAEERGNVVVIHGVMGSSLAAKRRIGGFGPIWVDPLELVFGRLDRLRLSEDGSSGYRPEYDVRATGILKLFYGEMILSLRSNWNVYSYWFDWRKELNTSARELEVQIDANFGHDSPVHIVAHSMGGLLVRTFIKNHPQRWEKMCLVPALQYDQSSNRAPSVPPPSRMVRFLSCLGRWSRPPPNFGFMAISDVRRSPAPRLPCARPIVFATPATSIPGPPAPVASRFRQTSAALD